MQVSPYTPGAGKIPDYLAGRDSILDNANDIFDSLKIGRIQRPIIYYGLRGVGKTVVLIKIEEMAIEKDIEYCHIEVVHAKDFLTDLAAKLRSIIISLSKKEKVKELLKKCIGIFRSFCIKYVPDSGEWTFGVNEQIDPYCGKADSGIIMQDLLDIFTAIGEVAQKANQPVCIFIDEIQNLKENAIESLIVSLHRISQLNYPLTLFAAGLPTLLGSLARGKSYAERLFEFVEIDSLNYQDTNSALVKPAKDVGVEYERTAIDKIFDYTRGYPYFIQLFGKCIWKFKEKNLITAHSVAEGYVDFISELDHGFFKSRFDRTTPSEKEFLHSMVQIGYSPCPISQVAEKMSREVKSISPIRASLIGKGLIYSNAYGAIAFSVPLFDDYLRRCYGWGRIG